MREPSKRSERGWVWGAAALMLATFAFVSSSQPTPALAQGDTATLTIQAWSCPFGTTEDAFVEACAAPLPGLLVGTPVSPEDFVTTDVAGSVTVTIPSGDEVLLRLRPDASGGSHYRWALSCESASGSVTGTIPDSGYDGVLYELRGVQPGDVVTCSYFGANYSPDGDQPSVTGADNEAAGPGTAGEVATDGEPTVVALPATGSGQTQLGNPVELLAVGFLLLGVAAAMRRWAVTR